MKEEERSKMSWSNKWGRVERARAQVREENENGTYFLRTRGPTSTTCFPE